MTNILYIVKNLDLEENVEYWVKNEKDESLNLNDCSIDFGED